MLRRHSQRHPRAGLISLSEARLHDCIKPAVWSVNVAVAAASRLADLDPATAVTEEGNERFPV